MRLQSCVGTTTKQASRPNAMPNETSRLIVDNLVSALPNVATDLLGRKPRKIKVTKKEKLKLYDAIDRLLEAQGKIQSFQSPAQTAAEYVSRLDTLGELCSPFLDMPKGVSFARSLKNGFRQTVDGMGRWTYFPSTNYRKVAADLDRLTSVAFAKKASATDRFLDEFWSSPDGAVVIRTPFTIAIRHCLYLGNARRKMDSKLIQRLIVTYRELSGLYEKGIRVVTGLMGVLEGKEVSYSQIASRRLRANLDKVKQEYPWFTRDFDVIIRNSIAHTNYVVRYSESKVVFVDGKEAVVVGFHDLFTRCRLLSSLTVALLLLQMFYLYWRWKATSDNYDSMKKLIESQKSQRGSTARSDRA